MTDDRRDPLHEDVKTIRQYVEEIRRDVSKMQADLSAQAMLSSIDRVRVDKLETTLERHSNELAEARGSNRTNRWLVIVVPPAILALIEILRQGIHGHGP